MIKAEFVYTPDDMKAFFKDYNFKKLLTTLIFVYIIVGILLFLAAKQFSYLFPDIIMSKYLPYITLIALIVIVVYCIAKALKETPNKMFDSLRSLYGDGTALFEFDENTFKHSICSGETKSETVIEYSRLAKAIESEYYFYIFTAENAAYVVRKSAFVKGTPDELRSILQSELDERFTIKKRAV